MKVLVFGDSITQGLWDRRGGWVERLRRDQTKVAIKNDYKEMPAMIFNLGVPGDTAEAIAKRLAPETKARQWADEQIVIIIAAGINDSKIFRGAETNSPEMFASELQQITATARQFTDNILFVGMTAVDERMCNPYKTKPDEVCFTNKRIFEFEKTLRDYCDKEMLPIVKIHEPFKKAHITEGYLADGMHPNDAGHAFVATQVKPALDIMMK
jgi:lysophospholipase L1-like esterase